MAEVQDSDVFLVGSVPLGSADEVFAVCGEIFGDRVFALPDGELDARRMWIGGLNSTTFSAHPDLELDPDHPPYPEESPFDLYRPKPKVERVSLKGRLKRAALDLQNEATVTTKK